MPAPATRAPTPSPALFVAVLVLLAAARLMRRNVDVLMDRAPADAEEAARQAIVGVRPPVQLRRLRMRQAAGRVFADVVIGVDFDAAVGQGHAAADAVERAVQSALPEADVVVHVEPTGAADADVRERAHAAALDVPRVREVHNVSVISVDSGTELSLHLKLPGDLSLEEAHAIGEEVERAIERAVPEVSSVQTHLEPLAEEAAGTEVAGDAATVRRIVRGRARRRSRGAALPRHRRGARRLPDAAARLRHARGRARRCEPDRGAHPARAPGDR